MTFSLYPSHPILIVDDEEHILKSFELSLKTGGMNHIKVCQDPRTVMAVLAELKAQVILLDLSMPHISGEELLGDLKAEHPDIPVIVITGDNEIETAVYCMKHGAFDYMVKPVEKSRLVSGVKKAIEIQELQYENQMLKERILNRALKRPNVFSDIITNNRVMLSLFQYAESIAASPQPVLITGETGVGKELMARAIHLLSKRKGEMVSINAAGIDDNVFADTLFGHVKGAYTGADQARPGIVERASGGTLMLDEIGDLNLDSQVKLLRLIQEGEYFPIGTDSPKLSDARIIVNTNMDLGELQNSGRFRKDLYYRLRAHHFQLPPLRERLDDIPLLVNHFLEEASESLKKKKPPAPKELVTLLSNYDFPGNVRELRTMVFDALSTHRSKTLSMKRFQVHMEQESAQSTDAKIPTSSTTQFALDLTGSLPTLKQATQMLINEAMCRTNQNQSMAARLIGVSRQTLARHLNAKVKDQN